MNSSSQPLEYTLLRSDRRKTLALQVKDGQIIVRAPYSVKLHVITTLIREKSSWLQGKIAQQKNYKENIFDFKHGAFVYIDGKATTLNVTYDTKADVLFFEEELTVVISFQRQAKLTVISQSSPLHFSKQLEHQQEKQVKKQLEQWLKKRCQAYINETLPVLVEQTTLSPSTVNIRQYKARWGSCNSKKQLSFNYLLMMTPPWVVDYVIIHELCHLQHLNHSARFWALVQQHYPNFKQAKAWLKKYQTQLKWQLPY